MSHGTIMKHKGFHASVMEAERLRGDSTFGLPPGTALPVYPSEIFKEYPGTWMRGPGVFVIPVRPNKGLWFNWTMNDGANTAILPTVKGCNPITGLQTSGFHLERYDNKCPKHDVEFDPDRYCEKCGYKWAPQNYCCAPNILWWDGFRAEDGTVRQFFFTEDEVRDIADKMIGKENTVPAFGFAFYRPKVERPRHQNPTLGDLLYQFPHYGKTVYEDSGSYGTLWTYTNSSQTLGFSKGLSAGTKTSHDAGFMKPDSFVLGESQQAPTPDMVDGSEIHAYNCSSAPVAGAMPAAPPDEVKTVGTIKGAEPRLRSKKPGSPLRSMSVRYSAQVREVEPPKKQVAVGAGAKIRQDLEEDPYPLDTWKDKPDSVMTIYFVFKEQVDKMLEAGTVEVTEQSDGMLKGMPVG